MGRFLVSVATLAMCGAASVGVAHANEPVVYTADYFEQFGPQSAADMVRRIPGFTIRGGEGGERGFGQASLNVLINGRRPSTKSLGVNAILDRISTERVVRIEVVDGTTLDIPGLSGDVANIVTEAFGLTGNWQYAARFEEGTEPQVLDGEASVTVSRGDVQVTLGADMGQFTYTEVGEEGFFLQDGTLFEDRAEDIVFELQDPELDAALTWTPPNGNVLNLNATVGKQNRNLDIRETFAAVGDGGSDGQSLFFTGEDELEYELGGDYAFTLGPGKLKTIGLYRFEDSEFTDRFRNFTVGRDAFAQEVVQTIEETEVVARSEYTIGDTGAWQVSGEFAANELEAATALNGEAFPNVRVTEDRLQGAVSHNRRLGAWDVQASAGVEYSNIEVPTSDRDGRAFWRPKGFVTASRDLGSVWSVVGKVERQVGQLNFFDFVDDIDLDEGRGDAGNEGIVPDQTWLLEATLERTVPKGLSGRINPQFAVINDPIDRVILAGGGEGPGNLSSDAYFWGVEGNFTWVLDEVLQGFRVEGNGSWFDTDIEDPLTGERRRFNGNSQFFGRLEARWDVPDTPYAFEVETDRTPGTIRAFRFNEAAAFSFSTFDLDIAAEHKAFFGMNLRVSATNLLRSEGERVRDLFAPDRFGNFVRREVRTRGRGRRLSIVLSDTF